jgi:hypothetical protein
MHIQYCIVLFLILLAFPDPITALEKHISATLSENAVDLRRIQVSIKIIGGQTAQRVEFPFAATLFFLSGKEVCSASIISKTTSTHGRPLCGGRWQYQSNFI